MEESIERNPHHTEEVWDKERIAIRNNTRLFSIGVDNPPEEYPIFFIEEREIFD